MKHTTISEFQSYINSSSIHWEDLYTRLRKQGLPFFTSLFQLNNLYGIPSNVIQESQKRKSLIRQRNIQMFKELVTIRNKLSILNPIPYKGIPFAKQFYGNIFQRTSVDIDFALDIEHFEKAKEIMLSLGYEEFKSKIDHDAIENSRAYYLDYPFVKRNAKGNIVFNVEFHWTPSHQILNIPIKFSEFANETEELQFGEHRITTFNKVHQALFAVIHHGNVDCWGKLKHLVDLTLILRSLSEEEHLQLEKLCKKYKIFSSLETGKALLGAIFGDEKYTHLTVSKKWTRDILNGSLAGKWSDNRMKMYYFLKSRDSWVDTISASYSILNYQLFIKPIIDEID